MHWGVVRAVGHRRVLDALLRGPALVRPRRRELRRLRSRVRRPDHDLRPDRARPRALGRCGRARGHEVRRLHDQAPRRLQPVGHRADRLLRHRSDLRLPRGRARGRHQGDLRRLRGARLLDRRLLLQGRLEPRRLLGAGVGHAEPLQQLRHAQVPRALAALPRLHARPDRGADDRLRLGRHPLARRRLGASERHDHRRGARLGLRHPGLGAGHRHAAHRRDGSPTPPGA